MKPYLVLITLLLMGSPIKGQNPIYWYDVDLDYVRHLVTEKVNNIRAVNRLPWLKNDRTLSDIAQQHSEHLVSMSKGSKQPNMGDQLDRLGLTSKNVRIKYYKGPIRSTYEESIDSLFHGSEDVNIQIDTSVDKALTLTGVGVTIDEKGLIIITQISSEEHGKADVYKPVSKPRKPDVKILPYNIKPYEYDPEVNGIVRRMHLKARRGKLTSNSPELVKKLFSHRNDGIVFEVVLKNPVSCGSNIYNSAYSRRNNNSSINGILLSPFYRKDLIKDEYFKIRKDNYELDKANSIERLERKIRLIKTAIGRSKSQLTTARKRKAKKAPEIEASKRKIKEIKEQKKLLKGGLKKLKDDQKDIKKSKWEPFFYSIELPKLNLSVPDSAIEINTLLLRKNKIVYSFYHQKFESKGSLLDSIKMDSIKFTIPDIEIKPTYKELSTFVEFDRNETQVISEEFEEFKLNLTNYLIDSIELKAFASVEGSLEINQKLFKARADSLYNSLSKYHSKNVAFKNRMEENWGKFYEQLKENDDFKSWAELPKDSLRKIVNARAGEESWDKLLRDQRNAKIRVVYHENIDDTVRYLRRHYDFKNLMDLRRVFDYLVYQSSIDHLNPKHVINFRLNKDSTLYSEMIAKKYLLEYEKKKGTTTFNLTGFFRRFLNNINPQVATEELLITYFDLLMKNWRLINASIPDNFKIYDELVLRGVRIKSMALFASYTMSYYAEYFNDNKARYYYKYVGAEYSVYDFPKLIYDFYINDSSLMNDYERCKKLALFLAEYDNYILASNLLQDYQDKHGFDANMKSIQLKLNYYHSSNDNVQFTRLLIEEHGRLTKEQWCALFTSDYPISFQSLDWPELRTMYCLDCTVGNSTEYTKKY